MATIHFDQQTQPAAAAVNDAPRELAHRSGDGVDVTLVWVHDGNAHCIRVCVCDRREGAYFEIDAEPYLALDVFYHPYFYRDFSSLDYEDLRLAAADSRVSGRHLRMKRGRVSSATYETRRELE
jgi:hypothetical protein